MGLNSSLSSPTSEQVCLQRGGGGGGGGARSTDGSTSCNRVMIFDHSLRVTDHKVFPGLKEIVHYST